MVAIDGAVIVNYTVLLQAFSPVAKPDARILILGSMPSAASLAAQQYYAHPRNAFWLILATITGVAADAPYSERLNSLIDARFALWDVLQSCERKGSLDSAIVDATSVANDFALFINEHPYLERVVFNGAKAEQCFRRQVQLPPSMRDALEFRRVPSTSPAHASWSFQRKLQAWQEVLAFV
jgi:hypoxanthine-DNA glycosylase